MGSAAAAAARGKGAVGAIAAIAPTMHPLRTDTRTDTRTRHTHGPRPAGTNSPPSYIPVTSPGFLRRPSLLSASAAAAAAERPHMSANTSRQKAASAEQRQPGLPSSQHKAASSYFQACSLSPSEGTLLCFSLSLSLSSLPVQLLHNTHQLFIACLPVSRQNQSQMESC